MARDHRLIPPRRHAEDRFPRDREGRLLLPRVRSRRPRAGDVHPIEAVRVRRLLHKIPLEYLYGLREIHLLPRRGEIGLPFGQYLPSEKRVELFSVPLVWREPRGKSGILEGSDPNWTGLGSDEFLVHTRKSETETVYQWGRGALRVYFIEEVLFHELGHHYSYQWKRRRRRPDALREHERVADHQGAKIAERIRRAMRATRKAASAEPKVSPSERTRRTRPDSPPGR